jgi:glycosyltransferase involved in cell wall biosynthesis
MSDSLTIWLLQTGEPLHIDEGNPRPMRGMNLANALVAAGHKVVLWSSSFYHQEKRHRVQGSDRIMVSPELEIRLISSPGYRRNIGPGRLWDHAVMARNLAKELSSESIAPDVAFIGYPPIETAAVMTRWLAIRGVPCMVDVKDQWPTIFIDALPAPLKPLGRIVLTPYFYLGRRAMREATALSAMADSFLQWAVNFAGRKVSHLDLVVPLTTPTGQVSGAELDEAGCWWDQQGIKADGTQRIIFVGSHSPAFDIDPVCEAVIAMERSGSSCQFVFCGDGPESPAWRARLAGLSNVFFPGWIDRDKIEALAMRSCAALAPYHNSEDFVMSLPNKVIDSLSLGLPVLSPLRGEVQRLILDFNVGLSYGPVGEKTLLSCIHELSDVPALRDKLSDNARKVFIERFSFESVYGGLISHLEMLASRHDKQRIR